MIADNKVLIDGVRESLLNAADEERKISGMRFFKEPVEMYGVRSAEVTKIGKALLQAIKKLPKKEVFILCEELWKSNMMEESFIACQWTYSINKQYSPSDFDTFEYFINTYINNWASCDTFCNHTMGTFIEMYPDLIIRLKTLALSPNRWMRRASAVSLIIPARRGRFLNDIFDIANLLLLDKDDMVQKGYGWMLKEASKPHQKEVFDFVIKNKAVMPRTALRYAIEKMPEHLRKEAMEKLPK
jgi:3-methyladenine DNA glycosylase AlkD